MDPEASPVIVDPPSSTAPVAAAESDGDHRRRRQQHQQQQQHHHVACRYRAANGALFSSAKGPPGPGLQSSCELPFGFLWTPLSPNDDDAAAVIVNDTNDDGGGDLPPVLCLTCLCYLNLYASVNEETGVWTCPLCDSKNVAPKSAMRSMNVSGTAAGRSSTVSPVLAQPFVEYRQQVREKVRDYDTCSVVLVMDENLPRNDVQAIGTSLRTVLPQTADTTNCRLSVSLIVFGRMVSIYKLGTSPGLASCDVFDTHLDLTEDLISSSYTATVRPTTTTTTTTGGGRKRRQHHCRDLESLWTSLSAAYGIDLHADTNSDDEEEGEEGEENFMAAMNERQQQGGGKKESRMDRLRKRKEERLRKQRQQQGQGTDGDSYNDDVGCPDLRQQQQWQEKKAKSPWQAMRERKAASAHPFRCTGEAIQCAIDLATVDPVQPCRTGRILLFTNGCPNYGDGSCCNDPNENENWSSKSSSSTTTSGIKKRRKKQDVVDTMKLARAVEYFGVVAKAAAEVGVAVDVLCSGSNELALPSYQALVEPSSGYALPHNTSFTIEQLQNNLTFLLQQTFVAGLHFDEDGGGPILRDEKWLDGCIVDIRTPSFMTPTHFVGPGVLMDTEDRSLLVNERSAFAAGSALAAKHKIPTNHLPSNDMVAMTMTRLNMGRYDPILTFSVMCQVNEFYQHESHALFQCVVRFLDRDGRTLVTRVFTHRVSMAKDVGEFLDAVDEEVVPVLLGKEAVYRSVYGREMNTSNSKENEVLDPLDAIQLENLAYDAQRDLDVTVQKISSAFRLNGLEQGGTSRRGFDLTEEGGMKAAGSSVDFAFPPELKDSLHRMYHFRRGPIISPGPMQSMDDRAEIRSLFLRLPLEDCLSMMALSLWSSGPLNSPDLLISPTTVPPDTVSLWDNCILAGDHYFALFLWSGQSTLDARFDEVRDYLKDFLLRRSQNRFPSPTLYVLEENNSMSRRFTALLAPSHCDPIEHQLANFPALGNLSPTELTQLQSKFNKFYDPETDASFRSWFWKVASPTSSCKDEGISLCE